MGLTTAPEPLFWYFLNERHRVYVRRAAGQAKPWTDDPILQAYKFTNVFRELDTGTVWLRTHFLEPHADDDPSLLVFNVGWYRLFNWIGTGERLGWQTGWNPKAVSAKLKRAHARGEQVFTGAHIVYGGGGRTGRAQSKIGAVVSATTELWRMSQYLASIARFTRSLQGTFDELTRLPGVGGFIGYEIVTDLRHTKVLRDAYDINHWANVGPGALRGLRRLDPSVTPSQALIRMRALLATSRQEIERVLEPHVPALELRDIEHTLCEFDKYCRVKFGEGKPRSLYPGQGESNGQQ